jgi:hypothetical protein
MSRTRLATTLIAVGLLLSPSLNAEILPRTLVSVMGDARTQPIAPVAQSVFTLDLSTSPSLSMLGELRQIGVGSRIEIRVDGAGTHSYQVETRHASQDSLEIRARHLGDANVKLVFGIAPEGVSGFLELPDGSVHALGYADGIQYTGIADERWMTDKLAAHAMHSRQAVDHEIAPVEGALPIHVDLALLNGMQPGDLTSMQFPGIGAARVVMDRLDTNPETSTWVGHLADFGDSYPVLITYSAESIEGSALTPQGEVIVTGGFAYNPQLAGLVNAKQEGDNCAMGFAAGAVADAATAAATGSVTPTGASSTTTANTGKTLDVLVYYSPGMETAFGSATAVATRVDALIAAANQAYAAGKLGYTLRRVGLKKVETSDLTANSVTLSRLQTGTGEFAGVKADRNALGADLVTLIRPLRTAQHISCGVAYVGGYSGSNIANYGEHMVSVVSDGKDVNGSRTYCDTMTLAHETGHNLGLMHDRATVASQGGGSGVKPYAFGYAISKSWGTIMSYTSPVQYRFSDPTDSSCPGSVPCGIAASSSTSADNVLALGHSLPIVAAFRNSGTTAETRYTISGIVTLDGKAIAGASLIPSSASVSCGNSGSTGLYTCQALKGTSFTLTPSISMNNGAKVTWTPATATFTALAANATANFSGKSTVAAWTVSGKILLDGKPVAGTKLKITGSGASCGASNSLGIYQCSVTPGASITLTPNIAAPTGSKITWSPASASFTRISANVGSANFSGVSSKLSRNITGKVSVNVNGQVKPLAGVTLKPSASGISCGATNGNGNFTCSASNMAGFTLTPQFSKSGYTFRWSTATLPAKVDANIGFIGTVTCPKTGCRL